MVYIILTYIEIYMLYIMYLDIYDILSYHIDLSRITKTNRYGDLYDSEIIHNIKIYRIIPAIHYISQHI